VLLHLLAARIGTSKTSRRGPVKSAYEVKAVVRRISSEDQM
jgi:hypothetical protein